MSLLYSLISRGVVVLAESALQGTTGNFSSVARLVLKKISFEENSKCSLIYDQWVFHYSVSDGFVFLCLSTAEFPRVAAFGFLQTAQSKFQSKFQGKTEGAIAFAFNAEFSPILEAEILRVNSTGGISQSDGKIREIQGRLTEVKDTMMKNIDSVLQRGERIELLVDKTEELERNAVKFQRSAKGLKRAMCIKSVKWAILCACVLTLLIYIILVIACGGGDLPKCK